jgi:hypothetical protein
VVWPAGRIPDGNRPGGVRGWVGEIWPLNSGWGPDSQARYFIRVLFGSGSPWKTPPFPEKRNPEPAVGLHEFAHLVDKSDGTIDGIPRGAFTLFTGPFAGASPRGSFSLR